MATRRELRREIGSALAGVFPRAMRLGLVGPVNSEIAAAVDALGDEAPYRVIYDKTLGVNAPTAGQWVVIDGQVRVVQELLPNKEAPVALVLGTPLVAAPTRDTEYELWQESAAPGATHNLIRQAVRTAQEHGVYKAVRYDDVYVPPNAVRVPLPPQLMAIGYVEYERLGGFYGGIDLFNELFNLTGAVKDTTTFGMTTMRLPVGDYSLTVPSSITTGFLDTLGFEFHAPSKGYIARQLTADERVHYGEGWLYRGFPLSSPLAQGATINFSVSSEIRVSRMTLFDKEALMWSRDIPWTARMDEGELEIGMGEWADVGLGYFIGTGLSTTLGLRLRVSGGAALTLPEATNRTEGRLEIPPEDPVEAEQVRLRQEAARTAAIAVDDAELAPEVPLNYLRSYVLVTLLRAQGRGNEEYLVSRDWEETARMEERGLPVMQNVRKVRTAPAMQEMPA